MKFLRNNYILILHLVICFLISACIFNMFKINNLNKQILELKYFKNHVILVQEAPKIENKKEKILIDYAIEKSAKKYKVSPHLIRSIIKHESSFNPTAMSDAGCVGLMQINPKYHKINKPFDIEENIDVGTRLISNLIEKYDGNVKKALWAYNTGSGNVRRGIIPKSTKKYAKNIIKCAKKRKAKKS